MVVVAISLAIFLASVAAEAEALGGSETFVCIDGPSAAGGPPPPPPTAQSCLGGCIWNGTDCVLRSPFRRLLFQEEFTGKSVDNRSWGVWDFAANMDPRRVRNNAAHDMVYASKAVSVGGGQLTIETDWHPGALRVLGNSSVHYTTGRLQTQHRKSWGPFGQFEATARMPQAYGLNNAVWLMPESSVKSYTEFDIMECLGRNTSVGHGTYHYGAPSGPLHHKSGGEFVYTRGLNDDFHTYGLLWTRDGLWWYVDNTIYHHFKLPSNATAPSVFFILQSNVGSNWAGKPLASDFPAKMIVDRVRVLGL